MRIATSTLALAAMVATGLAVPTGASAQRTYRDSHGRYHHRYERKCGSGNGAVGTVAGGVGGGLIANALGAGTLGTVAGAGGGALLGRTLDKKNTRDKNERRYGC